MAEIVELAIVRTSLEVPTRVLALLAPQAGAELGSVRPGLVEASLPSGVEVVITISKLNPYKGEAEAYLLDGKAVPDRVRQDLERWEHAHGRR